MVSERRPIALTIAGSDSGGGAGIQADLKTFEGLSVHGTSVVTCITAQNPDSVTAVQGCQPRVVQAQLEAVFAALPPRALKTGMLFTASIIKTVAAYFRSRPDVPLIVDPVMVSSSGAVLLAPAARRSLREELFPLARLITPNLAEAESLLGRPVHSLAALRRAARELHQTFGCATLVKGGHLRTGAEAIDFFYDGRIELMLSAPRVSHIRTHGTGCTYSAAVVAFVALGHSLPRAVEQAKQYISSAIHGSYRAGKHTVLRHRP